MSKPTYVDGFVVPIPKHKIDLYIHTSEQVGKIWKEYGALGYYEAIGDDLDTKDMVSFPDLAGAQPNETVAFFLIVFECASIVTRLTRR
jgi:uncharacterized protein YbaA (DUF1428 family)